MEGRTLKYRVKQFERQDGVQFRFNPSATPGTFVSRGDSVRNIYSSDREREFVQLKGELNAAKSSLMHCQSGEKESVIRNTVPVGSRVVIDIYIVLGQRAGMLLDATKVAGEHEI